VIYIVAGSPYRRVTKYNSLVENVYISLLTNYLAKSQS
jgi:hypothetical protein